MVEFDIVVIGAGHNGLVAATYLAKAGLRVVVLERANRVGGACVTDEIAPGFKVSGAADVSELFRPQIIEDLELSKFGLRQVAFDPQAFCPFPDGRALRLWYDRDRTCREVAKFSRRDATAYPRYEAMWAEDHDLIEPMLLAPPRPDFRTRRVPPYGLGSPRPTSPMGRGPDQFFSFRPVPGWANYRSRCRASTCAARGPIPEEA